MERATAIRITLSPLPPGREVEVSLRRAGERWLAQVDGGVAVGLGITARAALVAALEPLGESTARRLLADIGLLEPSLAVIELERSA